MKLWSKEALVLGGIYSVLEAPFSLLGFEDLSGILFVLFIGCAIMLCFNKIPKLISYVINQYPKISYYLCAIGWIPYFFIIGIVVIFILIGIFAWEDSVINGVMNIFNLVVFWGMPVCLVAACLVRLLQKKQRRR